MRCAALRFFTVYGPRQRPEMAITLFTRAALAGEPITVFGDGSMRRDFTHVDDIVRGVLAALERAPAGLSRVQPRLGRADRSRGRSSSAIAATAGVAPRVETAPVPLGDVDATFADIARAREELGWAPRIALREGLATVLAWVREHPASSQPAVTGCASSPMRGWMRSRFTAWRAAGDRRGR